MLSRANNIKNNISANNTFFVESRITEVSLPDATADCVISNCVINLVPTAEKQSAFNEMHRLLKPGGRVAISDILLTKELPDNLKSNVALYVGCISGASHVEEYERYLKEAKFEGTTARSSPCILSTCRLIRMINADIVIVADKSDLNVYKTASENGTEVGCCGPASQGKSSCNGDSNAIDMGKELGDVDLNEWAGKHLLHHQMHCIDVMFVQAHIKYTPSNQRIEKIRRWTQSSGLFAGCRITVLT